MGADCQWSTTLTKVAAPILRHAYGFAFEYWEVKTGAREMIPNPTEVCGNYDNVYQQP